jgi:hypothetical protein
MEQELTQVIKDFVTSLVKKKAGPPKQGAVNGMLAHL